MGMEIRPLNQEQMRQFLQEQQDNDAAPKGQWMGSGAAALGLEGEATPEDLERVYGVNFVQPTQQPPFPQREPAHLLSIGNVHVTEQHVITPVGTWPLAQVNVTTSDQTSTTTHTPAWAIVMVVLFIWFFLLSLLFLLARETRISGFMAVHVQAGGYSYTEQVPVQSYAQRADVLNRVLYLQSLIGNARNGSLG